MKSRAAVAFKAGEPLQIVEIDVSPPQKGEVLVKITHTAGGGGNAGPAALVPQIA